MLGNSENKNIALLPFIRNNIAFLIILSPLVLDILTGILDVVVGISIPLGAMFRFVILIITSYFIALSRNNISKLIVLFTFLYLLLSIYWFVSEQGKYLGENIKVLLVFLLPFSVFFLFDKYVTNKKMMEQLSLSISLYGLIASSSIIVFYFMNVGYESYGEYAFGSKGVFVSGNDIGINLILCSAIAWYRICRKSNIVDFIAAFSCYIGLIFIASRTGIIFGSLVLFVGVLCYLLFFHSSKRIIFFVKIAILAIVILVISGILWLINQFSDDIVYHLIRILELLDGVSPRAHLEYAANQVFDSLPLVDIFWGQGSLFFQAIGEEHYLRLTLQYDVPLNKMIEKDFHDLVGFAGIFFTIFYILILSYIFYLLINSLSRDEMITWVALFLFLFLMLHAFFAGHVIFGSQVPIIAISVIFLGIKNNKLGQTKC